MLRAWCLAHALCALATSRTVFQPDEHWQSLEIAHGIVFGYGYRTWEWTGKTPIRSIVHPASFVPLYAFLQACGLDASTFIMRSATHVRSASSNASPDAAPPGAGMALSAWPLCTADVQRLASGPARRAYRLALLAAFTAVLVRPTSLVIWSFLGLKLLWDAHSDAQGLWRVVREPLWIGPFVLGLGACADYMYFGVWTLAPLRFFLQNVIHGVSSFYGENAWHWYITLGLPTILSVYLPFFFRGIYVTYKKAVSAQVRTLLSMCAWTVAIFSLLAHKEVRFLQPLVPWFHFAAAIGMADSRPMNISSLRTAFQALPRWMRAWIYAQLPFFVYLTAFHTQGQVGVTTHMHRVATSSKAPVTVGFLMPCHSTPWQSHMHFAPWGSGGDRGRAWFLACPPPPDAHLSDYWDQSDFFFADPLQYMHSRFPATVDPSFPAMDRSKFIVPLTTGLPRNETMSIAELLTAQGYRETARLWNSVFHPEEHRRGNVVQQTQRRVAVHNGGRYIGGTPRLGHHALPLDLLSHTCRKGTVGLVSQMSKVGIESNDQKQALRLRVVRHIRGDSIRQGSIFHSAKNLLTPGYHNHPETVRMQLICQRRLTRLNSHHFRLNRSVGDFGHGIGLEGMETTPSPRVSGSELCDEYLALFRLGQKEQAAQEADRALSQKVDLNVIMPLEMVLPRLGRAQQLADLYLAASQAHPDDEELAEGALLCMVKNSMYQRALQLLLKRFRISKERKDFWRYIQVAILHSQRLQPPGSKLALEVAYRLFQEQALDDTSFSEETLSLYLSFFLLQGTERLQGAMQVLEQPHCKSLANNSLTIQFQLRECWKVLGDNESLLRDCRSRIAQGDRNWAVLSEYIHTMGQVASGSMNHEDVDLIVKAAEQDNWKDRGSFLGVLELFRVSHDCGLEEPCDLIYVVLVRKYLETFIVKPSCFEDIRPYLASIPETDRGSLLAWAHDVPDLSTETNIVRKHFHVPDTEMHPGDDLALLAVMEASATGPEALSNAAMIAIHGCQKSKRAYRLRLLLIRLLIRLGCFKLAIQYFEAFGLKAVQLDTVSHYMMDRNSSFGGSHAADITNVWDAHIRDFYVHSAYEVPEALGRAFSNGKFSQVSDLCEFNDCLEHSCAKIILQLDMIRSKFVNQDLVDSEYTSARETVKKIIEFVNEMIAPVLDLPTQPGPFQFNQGIRHLEFFEDEKNIARYSQGVRTRFTTIATVHLKMTEARYAEIDRLYGDE
ncbi:Similar to integral membrane protein involved in GPI anchor synthesis, putative alpha 1,2 mannosyltransferase [Malassezia sympodialis ATCC 42132]|uniref:uncharacterized protein n=1 Tax=Malassezia sympodialis (strain ATCC 42132) TaxID=1230383 RepID=UPI0002C2BEAE|nr:uncharacterized protein MSY001_2444 [Malassezia sympodialis ATCC 42132]CCU99738.1 Similar to integral membrane protein involved in GPI anchor synthesis, putative alpha 1,2 mannosyltransferase [Malassezia sympodialis ATCC 42132]|eukprot:XP_018740971.1 Similar to integral membrane protein involved in GPI anchor synthesis, putative alpha 1,2 mannosyltransferase [Malassezia sympodialis ATCC 42132]